MSDLIKTVGQHIKSFRNKRNLTQEGLAEAADLHPTYIAKLEAGTQGCSLKALQSIASALEVHPQALLGPIKSTDSYKLNNRALKKLLESGTPSEKELLFIVAESILKKRK